jgi:hypothetical protein
MILVGGRRVHLAQGPAWTQPWQPTEGLDRAGQKEDFICPGVPRKSGKLKHMLSDNIFLPIRHAFPLAINTV